MNARTNGQTNALNSLGLYSLLSVEGIRNLNSTNINKKMVLKKTNIRFELPTCDYPLVKFYKYINY